jgi:hypothetical protein
MGFIDPVLVCNQCSSACHSEEEFYKHHLKLLENGAYFQLSDSDRIYNCKLSNNHYEIIISDGHAPISMESILEIKANSSHSSDGSNRMTGMQLTYKVNGEQEKVVTFSPSPSHSRKQSVDWLKGLRKVQIIFYYNITIVT